MDLLEAPQETVLDQKGNAALLPAAMRPTWRAASWQLHSSCMPMCAMGLLHCDEVVLVQDVREIPPFPVLPSEVSRQEALGVPSRSLIVSCVRASRACGTRSAMISICRRWRLWGGEPSLPGCSPLLEPPLLRRGQPPLAPPPNCASLMWKGSHMLVIPVSSSPEKLNSFVISCMQCNLAPSRGRAGEVSHGQVEEEASLVATYPAGLRHSPQRRIR